MTSSTDKPKKKRRLITGTRVASTTRPWKDYEQGYELAMRGLSNSAYQERLRMDLVH